MTIRTHIREAQARVLPRCISICTIFLLVLSVTLLQAAPQDIVMGSDNRPLDQKVFIATVEIVRYRAETNRMVEPLLIFSPFSDPDVLGLIAVDDNLSLTVREVAANAVLDQLYLSDPYFAGAIGRYLNILVTSDQQSLRLKGLIGEAILEYRTFYGMPNTGDTRRLLSLQYQASLERDPQVRQLLDSVNESDPVELLGSAAWSVEVAMQKPYRHFDAQQLPGEEELALGESPLKAQWKLYDATRELTEIFNPLHGGAGENAVAEKIEGASRTLLRGFLARLAATIPLHDEQGIINDALYNLLDQLTRRSPDPYIRALCLAPISSRGSAESAAILLNVLEADQSPLTRAAAAEYLNYYVEDETVRNRMIRDCRREEDPRVRLNILRSLGSRETMPPEVQALFLSRLREEMNVRVLEFVVHTLGRFGVTAASPTFSRMLPSVGDVVLRARIAEALSDLGRGSRKRKMELRSQ